MFGGGGSQAEPLRLPATPDWPQLERLAFEAEAIGFHLTAHPLDAYAQALRRLGVIPCAQVEARAQAGVTRVKLAGNVVATKERITRTGSRMAWVRLSDASGSCEVTLFSEVLARARDMVADGANLLVTADLRLEGEALRVTAQDVVLLDQAAARGRRLDAGLAAGNRRGAAYPRPAGAPPAAARDEWCWCRGSAPSRAWRSRCPAASTSRRGWRRR